MKEGVANVDVPTWRCHTIDVTVVRGKVPGITAGAGVNAIGRTAGRLTRGGDS